MEDAVKELENCKRWLEMAFNSNQIRISDCENHYNKFKTLYGNKSAALKGTPKEAEWAKYSTELDGRYEHVKAVDEGGNLINKAKFNLRFCQSGISDKRPDQAEKYWEELKKLLPTLREPRFATVPDVQAFFKDFDAAKEKTLGETVQNVSLISEMEDMLRVSHDMATRGGLDRSLSTGTERAQEALEKMQKNIDNFKAKFGANNPVAAPLLKPIEDKMTETWNKIKAADEAGKAAKDKKKAEEEKAVWDCVETLPAKMKECIKAKKCTFSITGKDFKMQPYFGCKDCPNGYGLCVPCRDICHKQPKYASHRLEPGFKKGNAYCDCGCELPDCIAMPGRESAAAAAAKSAPAETASTPVQGLDVKPGNEYDPAFTVDISTNRSLNTDQREALRRYTSQAKEYNKHWREVLKNYETLLKRGITHYHIMGILERDLDSCLTQAKWMKEGAEKMKDQSAHPISEDIISQANKLMGACEQMRDDAQERSKKVQRDHRLEDCLKMATDIFDDAKANVDTKEGNITTKSGWYHVERIFIEARQKFDYLFEEGGDQPHAILDKAKPMREECNKLHEYVCVKKGTEAATADNQWDAKKYLEALTRELPNCPGVAKLQGAIDAMTKRAEEKRKAEEKAYAEKKAKEDEEERKRKAAMREKWVTPYTGGSMKVSGKDWSYGADGTLMGPGGIKILFDGSDLSSESMSGMGHWNGEAFWWRSHYQDHFLYRVQNGNIVAGEGAPVDWVWLAGEGKMMPKGPAANKFPAMQRTGSIPFPILLTVVMYDRIKLKENMLDGNCMCNQRLFDKGYDAFVCNDCHINRGHMCVICDGQVVIKNHTCGVCFNHQINKVCVVCKNVYGGWSHPAYVCDNCSHNFRDNCVMRH